MNYEENKNLSLVKTSLKSIGNSTELSPHVQARLDFSRQQAISSWKTTLKDKPVSMYDRFLSIFGQVKYKIAFTFVSLSVLAALVVFPQSNPIIESDKIDSISNYSMVADDMTFDVENI